MENISDKLFINLKKIGKIEKNGKIARSYDGIIALESNSILQPIKRFLLGDSRKQSVFEINSVVNETIQTFQMILNSKYTNPNYVNTDEYVKNCDQLALLLCEFEGAMHGIENLKFTYANDVNIAPQLDIIIIKIKSVIKDVSNKLKYYQSFLPQQPIYQIDQNTNMNETDDYNV
jgi:hypothetical protein